jgi:hypothetical protein
MCRDMMSARVLLLVGLFFSSSGFALGQERSASLPSVDVPTKLEPYADLGLVEKNARRAIALLATAQLKLSYQEPGEVWGPKITPECDSAEVRSFNRGYLLAHTGFNLFLSLQELGVPRVDGPHGLPGTVQRKFIQFGRAALLSVWTPRRLTDLVKMRHALRDLPQFVKVDLAAFLSKLMEYRQHYARIRMARGEALDDLFNRASVGYVWYSLSWGGDSKTSTSKLPAHIGYEELSERLDELARQVSDVAKADSGRCFVAHIGPTITFPSEKLEYTSTLIFPTKYLISFWRRRDMEGTSNIAAHVIGQVLEALRKT